MDTIYSKTAKGVREAAGKTRTVSRDLRTLLVAIDGKMSVSELREKTGGWSEEDLRKALAALVADGYIREPVASAPTAVQAVPSAEPDELSDLDFTSLPLGRGPDPGASRREAEARAKREGEEAVNRENQERAKRQAAETASHMAEARAKRLTDEAARREGEERAKREAAEAASRNAEAQMKRLTDEAAKREVEERAKREAAEAASRKVEAQAKHLAEEAAKRESEERAKREAAEAASRKAEAQMKRLADEAAKRESEERAKREAAEAASRKAEAQAKRLAEEAAQRESEERAKREAAEAARREAEAQVKRMAEAAAQRESEERAKREAAEAARREAEAQAKRLAEEAAQRESEERAKREAAEAARREAEAQAKRLTEEAAKRESEERAKREAAEAARREAEAQAKRLAEEAAQRESEERARREAAEATRREADAQAKRLAEEAAKRESEERAKREAAEAASREAEAQVKRLAEQAAERESVERAKREAAEDARREAEAQARRLAEEAAKREGEERAKREAAEAASREAEERAQRLAAEAAAREADDRAQAAEQARREAEQRATLQAAEQAQARDQAAERARRLAEEASRRDAEAASRREAEEARRREAEEARRREDEARAARQAEERARRSAERPEAAHRAAPGRGRKLFKAVAAGSLLLAVVGLLLLHVLPFDGRIPRFELAIAERLQQPVKIKSLRLALLPRPHWRLEGVAIGDAGQIRAPRIDAFMTTAALFGDQATFAAIEAAAPSVTAEGLGWLLFRTQRGVEPDLVRIGATGAKLDVAGIALPPLDVDAEIGDEGNWQRIKAAAAESKVDLVLQRKGEAVELRFAAAAFAVPAADMPALQDFSASGTVDRDALAVTEFQGRAFGGTLSGTAHLKWQGAASLDGEVLAARVDAAQLLPGLFGGGALDGQAKFSLSLPEAEKPARAPRLTGSFVIRKGVLATVDLGQVLRDAGGAGRTAFAALEGDVVYDGGKTQLRRLRLDAGALSARGNADVGAEGVLSGAVVVELSRGSERHRGDFAVSGGAAARRGEGIAWRRR